MIIISVYVLFAAGLPVWLILQPRAISSMSDPLRRHRLDGRLPGPDGLGRRPGDDAGFNPQPGGVQALGSIWPMMFCMIAAGRFRDFTPWSPAGRRASSFRGIARPDRRVQRHAPGIAPGRLRSSGDRGVLGFGDYRSIVWPTEPGIKSNPILGFSLAAQDISSTGAWGPRPWEPSSESCWSGIRRHDA